MEDISSALGISDERLKAIGNLCKGFLTTVSKVGESDYKTFASECKAQMIKDIEMLQDKNECVVYGIGLVQVMNDLHREVEMHVALAGLLRALTNTRMGQDRG